VILALLHQELNESAHTLSVLQDWEQGGDVSDEVFESALDFMDRFTQAVQASGLDSLAEYLGLVRLLLSQNYADPLRPDGAAERARLVGWPHAAMRYLEDPGSPHAVEAMEHSLAASTATVDLAWQEELIERLLDVPSLQEAADAQTDTAADEVAEDYRMDVAEVEPDQMQIFLFEAARQVQEIDDAVMAWGAGSCTMPMMQEAMRAAHTLKGSGYILGLRGLGRLAHHLEDALELGLAAVAERTPLPQPLLDTLLRVVDTLQQLTGFLQGQESAPVHLHVLGRELRASIQPLRAGVPTATPDPGQVPAQDVPSLPPTVPLQAQIPATQHAPLQLDAALLESLLRRAGQSLGTNARLVELTHTADGWLHALADSNRQLLEAFAELAQRVKNQSFQAHESMREREGFDPLELDRYDAIQNMVLSMEEKARDQQEFLALGTATSAQMGTQLRAHGFALADQRQDLLKVRTTTIKTVAARLRRTVAQTAEATGRKVRLVLHGDAVQIDGVVLNMLVEALLHVLRNAVDHGIEAPAERIAAGKSAEGVVELSFSRNADRVTVRVRDDGRGLDTGKIRQTAIANGLLNADVAIDEQALFRLILLPGFSTRDTVTETSGRGVGMDIVQDRLLQLQGDLQIFSASGQGCEITMSVQANSGVVHALLLTCGTGTFAIPSDLIEGVIPASQAIYSTAADGQVLLHHADTVVPVRVLADWLHLESDMPAARRVPVLVSVYGLRFAVLADAVLDARELILQGVGRLMRRLGGASSAALAPNGRAIFLLDLYALQRGAGGSSARKTSHSMQQRTHIAPARLLVVDDAWAVRMTMKQLLEDAGYRIETAHNGNAALEVLRRGHIDLVITDLEMPEINGLELARRMRGLPEWRNIPIVMLTSRSAEKHRQAALEAGISAYLTKPYRDSDLLSHTRAILAQAVKVSAEPSQAA
jgi:chemosensory pili system protein ChpA (sensor histidine kinase/response regulator)